MTDLSLMPDKGRNVAGTLLIRRVIYRESGGDTMEVDIKVIQVEKKF